MKMSYRGLIVVAMSALTLNASANDSYIDKQLKSFISKLGKKNYSYDKIGEKFSTLSGQSSSSWRHLKELALGRPIFTGYLRALFNDISDCCRKSEPFSNCIEKFATRIICIGEKLKENKNRLTSTEKIDLVEINKENNISIDGKNVKDAEGYFEKIFPLFCGELKKKFEKKIYKKDQFSMSTKRGQRLSRDYNKNLITIKSDGEEEESDEYPKTDEEKSDGYISKNKDAQGLARYIRNYFSNKSGDNKRVKKKKRSLYLNRFNDSSSFYYKPKEDKKKKDNPYPCSDDEGEKTS